MKPIRSANSFPLASTLDQHTPTPAAPHPQRIAPSAADGNAWREGDCVALPRDTGELPDRCVVCNAPADFYRQIVTFRVVPRAAAAFLFSPPLYAIAARATGTIVTVELGLCEKHRSRRSQGRFLKGAGLVVGLGLFFFGAYLRSLALMTTALLVPLVALHLGDRMMTTATIVNVTNGVLRLRVGKRFLASIPPRRRAS